MIDELLLLSGNDIPFPQGQITIHQPSLKQIAYITEAVFWPGCELLKFDKEILISEDKIDLFNKSNFYIIMTMIQGKEVQSREARVNLFSVLTLLFPTSEITLIGKEKIQLKDHQTDNIGEITENNFEDFKKILVNMFCLSGGVNKQYDPSGELAKKIANQIKRGREKKAKLASENKKISLLSRYASILAVGEQKDLNSLMNYTVYQLMDEFKRFELWQQYDSWLRFKCAGATDMQDPEDWFKDIHDNK